ncbi:MULTISPECIES: hypothetical protein [unclassified Methanoculleus]|jgi:hypothetical protein|uniref:hypothetical protein n=1 Tax=unclassified Methanoculleus TaxID=2619537 RepID=UPI003BEF3E3C
MLSLLHTRIALLSLVEREGLFFLDLFHRERKPVVLEEFLDLLEGLDVENDPDLSVVVGYDVLPFDIDYRPSPLPLSRLHGYLGRVE